MSSRGFPANGDSTQSQRAANSPQAPAVGRLTPKRPFLRNAAGRVGAFEAATSHFPQKATAACRTDGFRPKEKARFSSSGRHFPKTKETSIWGAAYESILEIRTRSLRRRWSIRSRGCGARVCGWGRLCRKARRRFKHLRRRRSVPTVQGDDLSPHSLAEEPLRDDQRLGESVARTPRPRRHSRALSATEPHPGAGREDRQAA